MKEKIANFLKIAGIVYLGLRLFSLFANNLVFELIDRNFHFAFYDGVSIFYFISFAIGLVCYLMCNNKKPVPVVLLIAACSVNVLAALVYDVYYVISTWNYYYASSHFTSIASQLISLAVTIVFDGIIFILVPMLISAVLCPNPAGGVPGNRQVPGMAPGVNGYNRAPAGQPQNAPGYYPPQGNRPPVNQPPVNRPPVSQPQYGYSQPGSGYDRMNSTAPQSPSVAKTADSEVTQAASKLPDPDDLWQ